MVRNDVTASGLKKIFSLGVDQIDLVSKAIPGSSKREKMHNILLLQGLAGYLGTGVARFTYDQLKEACLHYRAFDSVNAATYLKDFSADAGGDKSTGYALTGRGLANATELVKSMLPTKDK
jgi:hypothetical protein